jgi:hypothetical protein
VPAGKKTPYVGYFPQGRMDLFGALAKGLIPVTETAVDIISSCTLCGSCDRQCHFVTGMRPMKVMQALKAFLDAFQEKGGKAVIIPEDEPLKALKNIVGEKGYRVNTAEPAATVCANIVCTGLFSTWANVYGVGADHIVDMTFVDRHGTVFSVNDKNGPNVFGFEQAVLPSPGICTGARRRMHPVTDDEEGLLVQFTTLADAVSFAKDISRRIGLAVGILGGHYLSTFISPTRTLAEQTRDVFSGILEMTCVVSVIGDKYARSSIRQMVPCVIDSSTLRMFMLGLPQLVRSDLADIVQGLESDRPAYETVFSEEMLPVLEEILSPSPETIAAAVDEDLRDFYETLYRRPHMTDMVWLAMFRIVSARMSRHKHMFAFLIYVPLEPVDVIQELVTAFGQIAEKHGIEHDLGFITPLDLGKRGILEYDYYIDHTDSTESEKIRLAMADIEPMVDKVSSTCKGVTFLKYIFSQGCARKENFLYT